MLNTTLNLPEIPELLFVKNAVKYKFDKGYVTAILDKTEICTPLSSQIKDGKIARFGSVPLDFILDLGEGGMVVCGGFYFVQSSSSRPHIQWTTRGPSGVRDAV